MSARLLTGLLALTLLAGCAEHVDMQVNSDPTGAAVFYRIGVDGGGQPRTDWRHVGQTPFERRVIMPPFWSDPGNMLELRVERPGYKPAEKRWEPASVRTDGARLHHQFVLEPGPAQQ